MSKILVISNLYPSESCPFYGSFVKNFIEDLIEYNGESNTSYCVLKGRSYSIFAKLYKYVVFYLKIFYYLIFNKYDYIYVHLITHASLPIRIVSFFKKMNLIFNIHGEDLIVQSRLAGLFLEMTKPLLYNSKLVVVPSFYFKRRTIELLPELDESKIFVSASSGVKSSFFCQPINKKRNKYVGYVSRVDRGKGWDTLLRAAKIISDKNINLVFKIIGGGAEVDKMHEMISELGLKNIEYIGPVEYSKLPDYYRIFDVFVFPTKLEESLGLVGLEAMASGVPVIASPNGGIQDYLIDNVNGYYFDNDSEKDLSEKILRIFDKNDDDYNEMCKNAYEKSSEYKSSIVNKKLFDYIFNNRL